MSLARDDAGNIRELHSKASGLLHNFRDASGGTGEHTPWRKRATPIQVPGKTMASNPFSGRMTRGDARQQLEGSGRDDKAGSSSARRRSSASALGTKRLKMDHHTQNNVSRYFDRPSLRRPPGPSQPVASTSFAPLPGGATPAAIVIDAEDDAAAPSPTGSTNVDNDNDAHPREPIVLRASSPDPMDLIDADADVSYAFDQNKPSPIHQFSSSYEEALAGKFPRDGESTLRVRDVMKLAEARESGSHPDGEDVRRTRAVPSLFSKSGSAAHAEASSSSSSSGRNNVKTKVALFEQGNRESPRHINLLAVSKHSRKDGMKPKQVPRRNVPRLSFRHLDIDATRPSGFVSGPSKPSKGKATGSGVPVRLPLKAWSIGADIYPQEVTPRPTVNLVYESETLKLQHTDGSTPFELQVKRGSIDNVKYVDIKRTTTMEPLIQIHPSAMALLLHDTSHCFKPGSSDPDGFLTFKFDTSASDWDNGLYPVVVQRLVDALEVKDGKSILDGPAARAVWETVTRVQRDSAISSEPEPMLVDPPDPPSKPRPRPKQRAFAPSTAEFFVRRSARLSGGAEPAPFSPRPDPDEVILGYRSGTGSLNITNGDVGRLKPGEFLNDTLIEFGLKLWLADLQESNPELASQVHVFSSFFYKKISTKIPEEGYNSVRKWTSRFDIFQKKYIIVPINENLHWYLAIIYFPEYTLLPRPVQDTNVQARRSTRFIGVIIDSSDAPQSKSAQGPSLSPDPDLPPNDQVDSVSSGVIDPATPKTDEQKEEIDVERMVESSLTPVDNTAEQVGGQQAVAASTDTAQTFFPDSPELAYPSSLPLRRRSGELLLSDPTGNVNEQSTHTGSAGESEGNILRTSGISPSNFYGTNARQDKTSAQPAPVPNVTLPEIEIEDETIGNPESETEGAPEHPRTYIFTFDSLASKHPQAVKRLSRYLLMEARDKKQLAEDTLTEPKGMQAIVPAQPNYCDCGIYLLHFAKTFMKDPKLSSDIIRSRSSPQKSRRIPHEHWDGASVGSYREELAARIHSMSEEWKKQRGEQDSATKNLQNQQPNPNPNQQLPQADGGAAPQPQPQPQPQPPQQELEQAQVVETHQALGGDLRTTPTASSKADENDSDSDSDIEVLGSPQKAASQSKAPRRHGGLGPESRRRGPAARVRG